MQESSDSEEDSDNSESERSSIITKANTLANKVSTLTNQTTTRTAFNLATTEGKTKSEKYIAAAIHFIVLMNHIYQGPTASISAQFYCNWEGIFFASGVSVREGNIKKREREQNL